MTRTRWSREFLASVTRMPSSTAPSLSRYAFNDQTKVLNALLTEIGEANTLTRNDLALEVKMVKSLALSLGVSLRHNSQPQHGLNAPTR